MNRIKILSFIFYGVIVVLNPLLVDAQIVINEFLASNSGLNIDPDFNESADWIELYNVGLTTQIIGGYYLSDNFDDSIKWEIPSGTQIAAGNYHIIWADGNNTGFHSSFKLSASGEEIALFSPTGEVIDSLAYPKQETNISMGRKTDGSMQWSFFTAPTPGATNSAETFEGIVQNIPQFSLLGGIFEAPVTVEISNTLGGIIHYTLDGSEPDNYSPVVNEPFIINQTTIIRARILKENWVPGKIITHSYFIDSNSKIGSLPVVSIASNPENFWDSQKGIYVQDFKPDWEIPINIELFENDGSDRAGFNLTAGTKVNGLYSWQLPQKMLGIYFRKAYGKGKLDYPLFFDRERKLFDSFALRASGSDWAYTMFRDGMAQTLSSKNMDVDFQGYRASVVYVNGQYLGIHNIRSKVDEDFILQNHDLGDLKIDMVENENYVEAGGLVRYEFFEALYKSGLSNQANYNMVAQQMDVENFTDFIITEIYARNTSVNHNIMAWKPQAGGKWKWILNDLDRTFFSPDNTLIDDYAQKKVIPLGELLENEGYKHYFGKRLADHLFTTFSPKVVKATIDEFEATIENEIPEHIKRWKGTSSGYGDPISSLNYWTSEVGKLKTFADARPPVLLADLQNYGFEKSEPLSVSVYPESAGEILFNGLKIRQSYNQGSYPKNEEIELLASSKGGYDFRGWASETTSVIIAEEEVWKYNDSGNELGSIWKAINYSDENWKSGRAELGYGDGDENTVISYGGNSGNKYITSYFRKTFSIESTEEISSLKVRLKCDDGAVIYLNGVEVARENLPSGAIHWLTNAQSTVGGSSENDFTTYVVEQSLLNVGENIIAVEVHQSSGTSSDISFDLKLSAVSINLNEFINTNSNIKFTHTQSEGFVAVFENDGSCILPEEITTELILNKECSPYKVPNNVNIATSGKLIVEPGVELWMSDNVSIEINGSMEANGTKNEPVIFRSDPASMNKKWGILNFVNADTSSLFNVVIEDASRGEHPLREIAAVSAYHSVLTLNNVAIEKVYANPLVARYSNIKIFNSKFYSDITGDLVNIKYGKGFIDSCEFVGNNLPDTDAIDFDDITDGVIQNCVIYDFHGFNSDGIDIGEKAKNFTIQNVFAYNITDKGISVGQQSTGTIKNSVFVNCNKGIGLKDSSRVLIDQCTFYGNVTSIACYEKNAGDAGGNAIVSNCILSNVYETSYFSDSRSTIQISNSASDNTVLPSGNGNIFANPKFNDPNTFDFSLEITSPCVAAGTTAGNIGSGLTIEQDFSQLIISAIAYNSNSISEVNEFIELTNSGDEAIDISGFQFTKGITFRFPEGSAIKPNGKIYVAFNSNIDFWQNKGQLVFQWESGRLADEGEIIQLETSTGIIVDNINYNSSSLWPDVSIPEGIALVSDEVDNHFGNNWEVLMLDEIVGIKDLREELKLQVYPNPTSGIVYFSGLNNENTRLDIYNLSGVKVMSLEINSYNSQLNLSNLPQGVYLLRFGSISQRIVLRR
jgi:hypothetical protein